jgi:hypothetical protein
MSYACRHAYVPGDDFRSCTATRPGHGSTSDSLALNRLLDPLWPATPSIMTGPGAAADATCLLGKAGGQGRRRDCSALLGQAA